MPAMAEAGASGRILNWQCCILRLDRARLQEMGEKSFGDADGLVPSAWRSGDL